MYVVFPLIYALAKLRRKNAIFVHSSIFIYRLLSVYSLRLWFLRALCDSVWATIAEQMFTISLFNLFIARSCNFMSNKSSNFAPKCKLRNEKDIRPYSCFTNSYKPCWLQWQTRPIYLYYYTIGREQTGQCTRLAQQDRSNAAFRKSCCVIFHSLYHGARQVRNRRRQRLAAPQRV